ncbi:hypothetical protein PR048_020660 [Dryococelus australis]|uniref:Uncharacterized protein n=1 Tax=Dryococelus australis TaxID=614101 RepID=A0ABQ9H6W4_9NEOP|nr:hypothetical protein PR048_020660 [Dryococelus australis]
MLIETLLKILHRRTHVISQREPRCKRVRFSCGSFIFPGVDWVWVQEGCRLSEGVVGRGAGRFVGAKLGSPSIPSVLKTFSIKRAHAWFLAKANFLLLEIPPGDVAGDNEHMQNSLQTRAVQSEREWLHIRAAANRETTPAPSIHSTVKFSLMPNSRANVADFKSGRQELQHVIAKRTIAVIPSTDKQSGTTYQTTSRYRPAKGEAQMGMSDQHQGKDTEMGMSDQHQGKDTEMGMSDQHQGKDTEMGMSDQHQGKDTEMGMSDQHQGKDTEMGMSDQHQGKDTEMGMSDQHQGKDTEMGMSDQHQGKDTEMGMSDQHQGKDTEMGMSDQHQGKDTEMGMSDQHQGKDTEMGMSDQHQGKDTEMGMSDQHQGKDTEMGMSDQHQGKDTEMEGTEQFDANREGRKACGVAERCQTYWNRELSDKFLGGLKLDVYTKYENLPASSIVRQDRGVEEQQHLSRKSIQCEKRHFIHCWSLNLPQQEGLRAYDKHIYWTEDPLYTGDMTPLAALYDMQNTGHNKSLSEHGSHALLGREFWSHRNRRRACATCGRTLSQNEPPELQDLMLVQKIGDNNRVQNLRVVAVTGQRNSGADYVRCDGALRRTLPGMRHGATVVGEGESCLQTCHPAPSQPQAPVESLEDDDVRRVSSGMYRPCIPAQHHTNLTSPSSALKDLDVKRRPNISTLSTVNTYRPQFTAARRTRPLPPDRMSELHLEGSVGSVFDDQSYEPLVMQRGLVTQGEDQVTGISDSESEDVSQISVHVSRIMPAIVERPERNSKCRERMEFPFPTDVANNATTAFLSNDILLIISESHIDDVANTHYKAHMVTDTRSVKDAGVAWVFRSMLRENTHVRPLLYPRLLTARPHKPMTAETPASPRQHTGTFTDDHYLKCVVPEACEHGAALECKGGGNGKSPRKSPDQRHRPAQFPQAKIQVRRRWESNPVPLRGRRVILPLHHRGPIDLNYAVIGSSRLQAKCLSYLQNCIWNPVPKNRNISRFVLKCILFVEHVVKWSFKCCQEAALWLANKLCWKRQDLCFSDRGRVEDRINSYFHVFFLWAFTKAAMFLLVKCVGGGLGEEKNTPASAPPHAECILRINISKFHKVWHSFAFSRRACASFFLISKQRSTTSPLMFE